MLAYTGRRDRLEPRGGGPRPGQERPERVQARRRRGLRDLLHAAARRPLGAAGQGDQRRAHDAAGPAAGGGRLPERPGARASSTTWACTGTTLELMQIYVGVLAATILFIATNAGVIGASRITYSMASYRQLPGVFRRLHPRFKTPWLSLVVFAGIAPILIILPGRRHLRRDAVRVRCDAVVHGRARRARSACASIGSSEPLRYKGAAEPPDRRDHVAGLRDRRRYRDLRLVPRDPRPEPGHPLGGARLARVRARRLHDLPAPLRPRARARDRPGADARARPVADRRVPHDRRPRRPLGRVRGGARRRRAARRRSAARASSSCT